MKRAKCSFLKGGVLWIFFFVKLLVIRPFLFIYSSVT